MSCNTTQQVRFQLRRGTETYWNSQAQTAPLPGEPCFNTTTNQLKIGATDPNTGLAIPWGDLPYINVAGPVGTYTVLATLLTINPAVTLTPGANKFTLTNPATVSLGQRVQFTADPLPAPLNRFVTYYSLTDSPSIDVSSIQVSRTLGGPNIILRTSVASKLGANITIQNHSPNGTDTPLFVANSLSVGQALFFTAVEATGLSTSTLYYLVSIVQPYSSGTGTAIIQVSSTFGGSAIN